MRPNYHFIFFVGSFMSWSPESWFNDNSQISLSQEVSDGTTNGQRGTNIDRFRLEEILRMAKDWVRKWWVRPDTFDMECNGDCAMIMETHQTNLNKNRRPAEKLSLFRSFVYRSIQHSSFRCGSLTSRRVWHPNLNLPAVSLLDRRGISWLFSVSVCHFQGSEVNSIVN
jgi:hypothetical protein